MMNQQEEAEALPRRELQSFTHGKEADEHDASGSDGYAVDPNAQIAVEETTTTTEATTTTTSTATTTEAVTEAPPTTNDPHEQEVHQAAQVPSHAKEPETQEAKDEGNLSQEEYEALFPTPIKPRAATTFSLFNDPSRFSEESLKRRTHHVKDGVGGTLWLDADADGIRGNINSLALNALEFDTGIGGVTVQLVSCDTDEPVATKTSLPNVGVGQATTLKITQLPEAGQYNFPTDENFIAGRYYVMYKAPPDYRLSGSVLPLKREVTDEGSYFECLPYGGEGEEYRKQIEASGDLDWGGYCARSVGCMEVDTHDKLIEKFNDLVYGEYSGSIGRGDGGKNFAALPSPDYLDVGLAEEQWPLSTYQFADSTIQLKFPASVGGDALAGAVPQDFETSDVKKALESTIARMVESGAFTVQGVQVHGGEISTTRRKRMLRGLEGGDLDHAADPLGNAVGGETIVTYTLTSRGTYNPPPQQQLGTIMSESINSDPTNFVKSLKDRESKGLPDVFGEVADVGSRHLTVVPREVVPSPIAEVQIFEEAEVKSLIEPWAVAPIMACTILIVALTSLLLFRRTLVRRVNPHKNKDKNIEGYIQGTQDDFVVSKFDPAEDENKKSIKLMRKGSRGMGRKERSARRLFGGNREDQVQGDETYDNSSQDSHEEPVLAEEGRVDKGTRKSRRKKNRRTRSLSRSNGPNAGEQGLESLGQLQGGPAPTATMATLSQDTQGTQGTHESRRSKDSKSSRGSSRSRGSDGRHTSRPRHLSRSMECAPTEEPEPSSRPRHMARSMECDIRSEVEQGLELLDELQGGAAPTATMATMSNGTQGSRGSKGSSHGSSHGKPKHRSSRPRHLAASAAMYRSVQSETSYESYGSAPVAPAGSSPAGERRKHRKKKTRDGSRSQSRDASARPRHLATSMPAGHGGEGRSVSRSERRRRRTSDGGDLV